jgi:hypothetical protein
MAPNGTTEDIKTVHTLLLGTVMPLQDRYKVFRKSDSNFVLRNMIEIRLLTESDTQASILRVTQ